METHFIYADNQNEGVETNWLQHFFLKSMQKYHIRSAMVTTVNMKRVQLVTKEKMERLLHGNDWSFILYDGPQILSINDDLDIIFEDIRLGIRPIPKVESKCFPMLTEKKWIW